MITVKPVGVSMTNHLSAGELAGGVISRCAQSLHAVKLLHHHGMNDRLVETRLQGRRPLQAVSSFIYLNIGGKGQKPLICQ